MNHFTLIVCWCEGRDLSCSHSNGDIFTCKDNMLFSHVKISSFCAKAHLVFVYIIKYSYFALTCKFNGYFLELMVSTFNWSIIDNHPLIIGDSSRAPIKSCGPGISPGYFHRKKGEK